MAVSVRSRAAYVNEPVDPFGVDFLNAPVTAPAESPCSCHDMRARSVLARASRQRLAARDAPRRTLPVLLRHVGGAPGWQRQLELVGERLRVRLVAFPQL